MPLNLRKYLNPTEIKAQHLLESTQTKLSPALQHARLSASAKCNSFLNRHKIKPFTSWDELSRETAVPVPITIASLPISYANLKLLAQVYTEDTENRIKRALEEAERKNAEVSVPAWKQTTDGEGGLLPFNLPAPFRPIPRQRKAFAQIVRELGLDGTPDSWNNPRSRACLVPLPGGEGKTAIAAMVIKHYEQNQWFGQSANPAELVFYVTPKRVKEKTRRFLADCKIAGVGIRITPISYSELGTKKWASRFKEVISINPIDGKEIVSYVYTFAPFWPVLVIIDECHKVKKPTTKCAKLVNALLEGPNTRVLLMSATAAVVPNDLYLFAIASHKTWAGQPITKQNWKEVAWSVGQSDPKKSNGEAMRRFADFFGDSIVKPPADRRTVKCYNSVKHVDFLTAESEQRYLAAEKDYLEACERLGKNIEEKMNLLAKFIIFNKVAERECAPIFGDEALAVWNTGRSPIVAVRFLDTAKRVFERITRAINPQTGKNFTRQDVSVIWGGEKLVSEAECMSLSEFSVTLNKISQSDLGEMVLDKKTRAKYRRTKVYFSSRWSAQESAETQADRVAWLKANHLDKQNEAQQQEEVDRYLRGDTTFCIFTLAAGGTGIDLDQKFEHVRPRTLITTICYYLEEFAQAYFRNYRISTISDVYNYAIIPRKSIVAMHVAPILSKKLASINSFSQTGINLEEELIKAVVAGKVKASDVPIQPTQTEEQPIEADLSDDSELLDDEDDEDNENGKE